MECAGKRLKVFNMNPFDFLHRSTLVIRPESRVGRTSDRDETRTGVCLGVVLGDFERRTDSGLVACGLQETRVGTSLAGQLCGRNRLRAVK